MDKVLCRCGASYYPAQAWIHAFCRPGERVTPSPEQRKAAYDANRRYGEREMLTDIERMLTGSVNNGENVNNLDVNNAENVNKLTNVNSDVNTLDVNNRAVYMREYMKRRRESEKSQG